MKLRQVAPTLNFFRSLPVLLLLLSCEDKSEPEPEKAPSGYSFVSIEYTLLDASPLRELSEEFPCANDGGEEIISINKIEDYIEINSLFSDTRENLAHADMIGELRVPIPKLDAGGTVLEPSDLTIRLAFGTASISALFPKYASTISIPPRTTYTLSSYSVGWNVSARYTCTVENNDTKERITFSGNWKGDTYYRQEVRFTDDKSTVVGFSEFPLTY